MILPDQKHALAVYRIALAMRCTQVPIVQSTIYNGTCARLSEDDLADAKREAHVPCTSC
jgi:hypothetical protein